MLYGLQDLWKYEWFEFGDIQKLNPLNGFEALKLCTPPHWQYLWGQPTTESQVAFFVKTNLIIAVFGVELFFVVKSISGESMGRYKKKSIRCKTSKRESKIEKPKSPANTRIKIPLSEIIDQDGKSSQLIRNQILRQNKSRPTPTKCAVSPVVKMKINRFLFGQSPRPNVTNYHRRNGATKSRPELEHNNSRHFELRTNDDDSKADDIGFGAAKQKHHPTDSIKSATQFDDDSKEGMSRDKVDGKRYAMRHFEEHNVEPLRNHVIELRNLDRRVLNEKVIQKIINKKLMRIDVGSEVNGHHRVSLQAISIAGTGIKKFAQIMISNSKTKRGNELANDIVHALNGKKLFGKVLECRLKECRT